MPSEGNRECCESEVGLRLAAPGWKPEQIADIPVCVVGIRQRRNIQENKCELKGAPVQYLPTPLRLHRDGLVGKAECQAHLLVTGQEVYGFPPALSEFPRNV